MTPAGNVLGIDVGSVSVSYLEIDASGEVVTRGLAAHGGKVRETLGELLPPEVLRRVRHVAATSSTPAHVARSRTIDSHLALVTAARRLHGDVRSVLLVGGERFSLTRFDDRGAYLGTKTNSSCAAGTGSFLDQQAETLGLGDGAALAAAARKARGEVPKIASRCAVFARTDLIHAQQEGYGLPEICDGLCRGLAAIVADTLAAGEPLEEPVAFLGGVARNEVVRRHLEARLGVRLHVHELAPFHGALGAALLLLEEAGRRPVPELVLRSPRDLVSGEFGGKRYFYEPLDVARSPAPDFPGERSYEYVPRRVDRAPPVEVDIYRVPASGEEIDVLLGADVGSTSTKAVLLEGRREVLAGFYTRTAGRPIPAAQGILEAIHEWSREAGVTLRVRGAGTTGSGRKLVGAVLGADLVVDEITAHARAAVELDPETDTIIEIGGQDAKFTTLRNGMVTSAVMNTVCAAGTGTFIEEQARRLGCPLSEMADRVAGVRAPLASDRCTVFMQRDINHLLGLGYSVDEILATVLHSVRENYLGKVAREGSIGSRICFQGATAKNRALVAAFEQRLGRPIRVSRYCHLTGALGTALLLAEKETGETGFRGLSLHRERIPVRNERCGLCRNHCRIVIAEVRGEEAAYGFLCGRDHEAGRPKRGSVSGFDLLLTRRRILRSRAREEPRYDVTIGLPAALTMFEDLELWRMFFQRLGVRVVTTENLRDPVGKGKKLARAEFCAPLAAWHAHVDAAARKADYVFAPVLLEARPREPGVRRQYCYYTQFASSLADTIGEGRLRGRILRPLITRGLRDLPAKRRLLDSLRPVLGESLGFAEVSAAFTAALESMEERRARLREVMRRELEKPGDVAVVLLGRPYACLPPGMNKGIPDILDALGIRTFFHDMLEVGEEDTREIADLLAQVHWNYAARILSAAQVVARTPGFYPVLVSSFKCAPDSMTLEFFRRILDREGKPYLVLELDEHDSSVGYETRIEAAVHAFRNHRESPPARPGAFLPVVPRIGTALSGRTLFLPNWDGLSCALLAANLRREGIDAHLLTESTETIRKSLRRNTGQCIPLHAIVEGFVDEVRARGLDPAKTALWMIDSKISCNLGMYPGMIKALLESRGGGFEHASVYCGDLSFIEVSVRAAINCYFAYMFGGMLRRLACRVRPYEKNPGEADAALEAGLAAFLEAFEGRRDKLEAVREVVDRFAAVETHPRDRPKVAVFGDLYVRDNRVISQGLVRFIERHGGEVVTTPYSEYVKIVAPAHLQRWFREGKLVTVAVNASLLVTVRTLERRFLAEFSRVLGTVTFSRPRESAEEILARFGVTDHHTGESLDNLLKVFHILETHPDLSLFVQANPAFCCPSLVTEAMAGRIRELTGVPVVTVTYDGTAASVNDAIIPHLHFAAEAAAARASPARPS